ncbi:hypothetical protein CPTAKMECS_085 [Salmonella phage vB_SenS-AKM_ECS]|uniref:Uncharacterized protein n=1 Tax=Salmonella phage vB_SenS-AKM_HA2021_32 TaxID=3158841 RepID=A0AAU7L2L7_9CAUD|nr:hypothetical protein CPTAKMECS_085 [Salmonella phage vB_SenS-AKM_ECS]
MTVQEVRRLISIRLESKQLNHEET